MTHHVFISYRRKDGDQLAHRVKRDLEGLGVNVFLDNIDLKSGSYAQQLEESIEECLFMVPVWTPSYFERCSEEDDWVYKELLFALEFKKRIVPVVGKDFVKPAPQSIPESIRPVLHQQGIDYSLSYHDAFVARLLEKVNECKRDTYRGYVRKVCEDGYANKTALEWLREDQEELGICNEEADLILTQEKDRILGIGRFHSRVEEAASDGIIIAYEREKLEKEGKKWGYSKEGVARLIDEAMAKFGAQSQGERNEQVVHVEVQPSEPPESKFHHPVVPQSESVSTEQVVSRWFASLKSVIIS